MHYKIILPVVFIARFSLANIDPTALAARYYSDHNDYKQAYTLWLQHSKRFPESLEAFLRIAELKLLLESRSLLKEHLSQFLGKRSQPINKEEWFLLRDRMNQLRFIFKTDNGQSLFLQAMPKIQRSDCTPAVALLNQALTIENDHTLILWERAKCELKLLQLERAYETLKRLQDRDPLFPDVYDDLAEAHLYFGNHREVSPLLNGIWNSGAPQTVRQRIALAIALVQMKRPNDAFTIFRSLLESSKHRRIHPVVYYWMGKIRASHRPSQGEALTLLKLFLSAIEQGPSGEVWDPYRLSELQVDAKKLLTQSN